MIAISVGVFLLVRTMLEAIISFMPTEGAGAIGALDWTADERKRLAKESKSFRCPHCGPISDLLCEPAVGDASSDLPDPEITAQVAQLHMTRQHSSSEQYRAGGLISDMASGNGQLGMDALPSSFSPAAAISAIVTAEEDVSAHVHGVLNSFENDPDNDCTLNQMINMELDRRCASPPNVSSSSSVKGPAEAAVSSSPDRVAVGEKKTSSEPFTTETLATIRKQRLAEQKRLSSPSKPDVSEAAPEPDEPSSVNTASAVPPPSESPSRRQVGSSPSTRRNSQQAPHAGEPTASAAAPAAPQPREPALPRAVPVVQPPVVARVVQRPPAAAVVAAIPTPPAQLAQEEQRRRDKLTFDRLHLLLNTLIFLTIAVTLGVVAKIIIRSADHSPKTW